MRINIIGGGISGLTAAYYLEQNGHQCRIIEQTDRVGGRIKTDIVEGYRLDRGFQVFLTAYPEAKALLNYEELNLKEFMSGAAVATRDGLKEIGDPAREKSLFFKTAFSSLGNIGDKYKTYSLKKKLATTPVESIFSTAETPTADYLQEKFSTKYYNAFFAPFYKGIMLDKDLNASSRMFEFVFKMFSQGSATVPALGMEEIPKQIASKLENTEIVTLEKVTKIEQGKVTTHTGKVFEADVCLIATQANSLAKHYLPEQKVQYKTVSNLYFSAYKFDFHKPCIILSPETDWVNNVCCISKISNDYSPPQKQLVSVSVLHDDEEPIQNILGKVTLDLKPYFDMHSWNHLKTYHIPYALPNQENVNNELSKEQIQINENLYICGDHMLNGSINAAMKSGRLAAECISNQ